MNLGPTQTDALPVSWAHPQGRCIVLGHRGARHAAPENTLSAFELARTEGALGTELDVQTSADGYVHVVHDLDLARVTSRRDTRAIRHLMRAELDTVQLDGEERIPRLEQVLAWAEQHQLLLNVELKTADARHDRVAEATAQLLAENVWAQTHVCISSFHPTLLSRFARHAPMIRTAFLVAQCHKQWCSPGWLHRLGASAIHPQASLLLPPSRLAESLAGFQINTWTVNDPAQARQLRDAGVFALISDNPAKLLAGLH